MTPVTAARRTRVPIRRPLAVAISLLLLAALLAAAPPANAQVSAANHNCDRGSDAADERFSDVDVVFVGAHPDDDSIITATMARMDDLCLRTAVITATRGEGGGNAVNDASGEELGRMREAEERAAMRILDVDHVHYLDELDFFFTQSSEVTEEVWGHDTLPRLERLLTELRPEVIVTMNPSANSGHGNHQLVARLATEAFNNLGTLSTETWQPLKLYYGLGFGSFGLSGEPVSVPTDEASIEEPDKTYGELEALALCEYVTQNFCPPGGRTPATSPETFQLAATRVPLGEPDTLWANAVLPAGDTPLGTLLRTRVSSFEWLPGNTYRVEVVATNDTRSPSAKRTAVRAGERTQRRRAWHGVRLDVAVPDGWRVRGRTWVGDVRPGRTAARVFEVTVPADAEIGLAQVSGIIHEQQFRASAPEPLKVIADVEVSLDTPEWVDVYRDWTRAEDVQEFAGLSSPQFVVAVGDTTTVAAEVVNNGDDEATGELSLDLPAGYTADPATRTFTLPQGGATTVEWAVTADASVEPGRDQAFVRGEPQGDPFTLLRDGNAVESGEMRPVPQVTVPRATPTIDGDLSDFPTAGELDLNRRWEGAPADSPEDYSGVGYVAYDDEFVYVAADITDDDVLCTTAPDDVKKLFRTDNVEIGVDPSGDSGISTLTVFKIAVIPCTTEGFEARAFREADEDEGVVEETAPETQVASRRTDDGYVLEVAMPRSEMDDGGMPGLQPTFGLNVLPYDAAPKTDPDTGEPLPIEPGQNYGQSRFGWSVWGAVQANPYLWGEAHLGE